VTEKKDTESQGIQHPDSSSSFMAPPAPHNRERMVQIQNVSKWYGSFRVLNNVSLDVYKGECLVICGPSGSGKSTLIRCVNALDDYQEGSIIVDGITLTHEQKTIDKIRRDLGIVFQTFNLFPHLTILQNCTLAPIWVRKLSRSQAEEEAMHYLTRVHIPDQAHKYPVQLSGGQQQRAAIARALCMSPKTILFDEPTSALDPEMVQEVLDTMSSLAEEGRTMIVVTHEMSFARHMADRVVFMDSGAIVEMNTPDIFFSQPQSDRAQAFLKRLIH
jgi:general L-amino acid transport system ATP-binding protein